MFQKIIYIIVLNFAAIAPVLSDIKSVCFDDSGPCQRHEKLQCPEGSNILINDVLGWFRPTACNETCRQLPNKSCCSYREGDLKVPQRMSDDEVIKEQCSSQSKCFPFDGLAKMNNSDVGLIYIAIDFNCKASSSVNIVIIVLSIFLLLVGVFAVIIIIYCMKRRDQRRKEKAVRGDTEKESGYSKDRFNKNANSSRLFSIITPDKKRSKRERSKAKDAFKEAAAPNDEEFDAVRYSERLRSYLTNSQERSYVSRPIHVEKSGLNLVNTLSCLGIEVADTRLSKINSKTRRQPGKEFAKRSHFTTSSADKMRASSVLLSPTQLDGNHRKYPKQEKTDNDKMKDYPYHDAELIDDDFDNIQYLRCSTHKSHVPQISIRRKESDTFSEKNTHEQISKKENTPSCTGIRVIEPKYRKKEPKHGCHKGNQDDATHKNGSVQDNIAREETPNKKNNETPSDFSAKTIPESTLSNINTPKSHDEKRHQRNATNSVPVEIELSEGQDVEDSSIQNTYIPAKRNKYQWTDKYEKLKALSQVTDSDAKPSPSRNKTMIQTKNITSTDDVSDDEASDRHIRTEEINDATLFQNNRLKAIHKTAAILKQKKSESFHVDSNLKFDAECIENISQISKVEEPINVSRSDPKVRRSLSMPSEYTEFYKLKMSELNIDRSSNEPTKMLQSSDVKTQKDFCESFKIKEQRKRKRSKSKLQMKTDQQEALNNEISMAGSISTTVIDSPKKYMNLQQLIEKNTDFAQRSANPEATARTDLSVIDPGLSFKELTAEEEFVPLPASNIEIKRLKQSDVQTLETYKHAAKVECMMKSTQGRESSTLRHVKFGEYVPPKTIQTAVVRPMVQQNAYVSKSDSFTYPFTRPESPEAGPVRSAKRIVSDNLGAPRLGRAESFLDRPVNRRSKTNRHSGFKAAIHRKPSMDMPRFVNMSSLMTNIKPARYKNISDAPIQTKTKSASKFHSERNLSFKSRNTLDETIEDGRKSKALLFSRGMNEENTTKDLNDMVTTSASDDTEAEMNENFEARKVAKDGNPHRTASFLIQSTADKAKALQRSKSERKLTVTGSKL